VGRWVEGRDRKNRHTWEEGKRDDRKTNAISRGGRPGIQNSRRKRKERKGEKKKEVTARNGNMAI